MRSEPSKKHKFKGRSERPAGKAGGAEEPERTNQSYFWVREDSEHRTNAASGPLGSL